MTALDPRTRVVSAGSPITSPARILYELVLPGRNYFNAVFCDQPQRR